MGAEHCSDAELLAILIGSGGRDYSALDSANAILDKYGTLAGLMNRPLDEVAQIRGIKVVRAIVCDLDPVAGHVQHEKQPIVTFYDNRIR